MKERHVKSFMTALATAGAIALAAGCSGGGKADTVGVSVPRQQITLSGTPSSGNSASSEPEATPTHATAHSPSPATSAPTKPSTKADGKTPTDADLKGALLAVGDMPSGFSVDSSDSDSEDDSPSGCAALDKINDDSGSAHADVTFTNGGAFGSIFLDGASAYPSESAAADRFKAIKDGFNSCTHWKATDEDGVTTYDASPLSFDKLGDATFALHISMSNGLLSDFGADIVYIRVGQCGATLMSTGFVQTPGLLAKVAPKAVAKLKKVCSGGSLLPI